MAEANAKQRLHRLLENHAEGAFTDWEVVHCSILLFDGGDEVLNHELWLELPDWVRNGILSKFADLPEDFCVIKDDPEIVHKIYFNLRSWLVENKLLQP